MKMIAQGAEASIIDLGEGVLKKVRESKPYRISELDVKLRKSRNKREFKVLGKLFEKGINAPEPFELNDSKDDPHFTFEYIEGTVLKECLDEELLRKAFKNIIDLHDQGIVHGDLTTLNMIVRDEKVFLIDFGLSEFSEKVEDRAVDLNLFFTCIKNEHPDFYKLKDKYLKKYFMSEIKRASDVVERLEQIEQRGRNK